LKYKESDSFGVQSPYKVDQRAKYDWSNNIIRNLTEYFSDVVACQAIHVVLSFFYNNDFFSLENVDILNNGLKHLIDAD